MTNEDQEKEQFLPLYGLYAAILDACAEELPADSNVRAALLDLLLTRQFLGLLGEEEKSLLKRLNK